MRTLLSLLVLAMSCTGFAAENKTIDFNYKNAEIGKVIADYARASGQKFIVDPAAQGSVTVINAQPVNLSEAFDQLSSAMAVIGLGFSKQGDTMVVMQARALQRNLIDVGPELPSLKPERMYTWIINLKYASADEVNKQLRILTSKDGELVPYTPNNQIYVSDWTSNLHRISKILKEIDIPIAGKSGKLMKKTSVKSDRKQE